MGTFVSVLLDILSILAIIVLGAFVVVVIADLILFCIDGNRDGIIFHKNKKDEKEEKEEIKSVTKDDIVVYSNQVNPNGLSAVNESKKDELIDGNKIEEIDYDKAVEEQQMLQAKKKPSLEPVQPKKVEKEPEKEEIFWDNDDEDEFNSILDEVVKEAKKSDETVQKEIKIKQVKDEDAVAFVNPEPSETQKELEELRALKEQQQKEIEEFRQMKEDFAREKEEQLAMLKENLDKARAEEIEKIRQEAIKEQEKIEELQEELESEQSEPVVVENVEPIVKETIIKDEEEINKLRYKNLMRMNNRLTRIIRDTEKLQIQKQKAIEKQKAEKEKLLAKEEQERLREQEKIIELQKSNHEKLVKQQEALQRKFEISKKLNEVSRKAGKYKLNSAQVKVVKESVKSDIIEEVIVPDAVEVEKPKAKSSVKPTFEKEYYEARIQELEEEMKEAEKELKANKSEYVPLTRIHKAYERDSEKLRKKEILVAKQKVALYGVNSTKVDSNKKAKLDENLKALAELKDSVEHCEEVIAKNKDRYPVLEKNNKLILKHIDRINEDIKVCNKALAYYNKNNK